MKSMRLLLTISFGLTLVDCLFMRSAAFHFDLN